MTSLPGAFDNPLPAYAAAATPRRGRERRLRDEEGGANAHPASVLRRLAVAELMGIFYWRLDGTIYDADDTFLALTGYTRDDLAAGRVDMTALTPEEYRARDEAALRSFRESGVSPHTHKELVCKDGSRLPVLIGGAALDDDRTTGVAFLLDMTQQKQEQDRLRAAFEKEHHIAQTLQRSLLMTPPPDAFPGISVKAIYESAYDDALIGGDFFDIFAVSENRVALVVGDATGKGLDAAMFTAEVKFALRAFLREDPSPAATMERLNNFVVEAERLDRAHLGSTYVALSCAIVDTTTGLVTESSAGMEPPVILRCRSLEAVEMPAGGLLLGVSARQKYDEQTMVMAPGDTLALTTDGITEARGADDSFFGYDGLVTALRETLTACPTLAQASEEVIERARSFAGSKLRDDVCLLLCRRR